MLFVCFILCFVFLFVFRLTSFVRLFCCLFLFVGLILVCFCVFPFVMFSSFVEVCFYVLYLFLAVFLLLLA